MIHRFALATVLIVVASSSPIQAETLEQLRDNYQKAHETSSNIEDPKFGNEDFREKLAIWADANKKSQLAAQKLISALFKCWIEQPNDETLKTEIESVYQGLAGKRNTERYTNAKSFITRISWPLLTDSDLTDEQAELLSKLIKPQGVSRIGDVMARVGLPSEAYGWDQQAAYAMALMRLGKEKQARQEISNLHAKASTNYKANPKGSLDYGPEAGVSRYRDYVDYLQLCEVLSGFQDSVSNNHKNAAKHVTQARNLRYKLSPEAMVLVVEINRRSRSDQD